MSTRGLYGFRKDGVDKCTYNHFSSYPDWLGRKVVEFCKNYNIRELKNMFNKIVLIDESSTPTFEQIDECIKNGFADFDVSRQSVTDWYCLLRNTQGDLECLARAKKHFYMEDKIDFIKDSLWCEYGYIINLDEEVLEFYVGFQNQPQEGNRYGIEPIKDYSKDYYPCKLLLKIPLDEIYEINDVDKLVRMMQDSKCKDNMEDLETV